MEKYKPNKYLGYIYIKMTNSGAHVKYITETIYHPNDDRLLLLTVDNMTGKKQSYVVHYTRGYRPYVIINGGYHYSEQWVKSEAFVKRGF